LYHLINTVSSRSVIVGPGELYEYHEGYAELHLKMAVLEQPTIDNNRTILEIYYCPDDGEQDPEEPNGGFQTLATLWPGTVSLSLSVPAFAIMEHLLNNSTDRVATIEPYSR
jgi:hypothetical protein